MTAHSFFRMIRWAFLLLLSTVIVAVNQAEPLGHAVDLVIAVEIVPRYKIDPGDQTIGTAHLPEWISQLVTKSVGQDTLKVAIVKVGKEKATPVLLLSDNVINEAGVRQAVEKIKFDMAGAPHGKPGDLVREVALQKEVGNRMDVLNFVIMITLGDPEGGNWQSESWVQGVDVAVVMESYNRQSEMVVISAIDNDKVPDLQSSDGGGATAVTKRIEKMLESCSKFVKDPEWHTCDCKQRRQQRKLNETSLGKCRKNLDLWRICNNGCPPAAQEPGSQAAAKSGTEGMPSWVIVVIIVVIVIALVITAVLIGYCAVKGPRRHHRHGHHHHPKTSTKHASKHSAKRAVEKSAKPAHRTMTTTGQPDAAAESLAPPSFKQLESAKSKSKTNKAHEAAAIESRKRSSTSKAKIKDKTKPKPANSEMTLKSLEPFHAQA